MSDIFGGERDLMSRGAVFIIGVVLLGLGGGAFAVWWNVHVTAQSRAFWGEPAFTLARTGPHVEYLRLTRAAPETPTAESDSRERILVGEQPYFVDQRITLDDAKGMVHLRHAVTADDQYLWNETPSGDFEPTIGLRVSGQIAERAETAILLFDVAHRQAGLPAGKRVVLGRLAKSLPLFIDKIGK